MSQSVKQCITVDFFPHNLANVVDIQKEHLLLHTPVLSKTPRLFSARMFVRLYRLLLIHCIYVLVTKPTYPAFSAWLNTCSIRSLKVTGKLLCSVVWHYHQSYVQHYMANMCYCKTCRNLNWPVLVGIQSGVDSDHGTCPRRNGSVNSRSTLCPIYRSCWPKTVL